MRENEKIRNEIEDKQNVIKPVIIVTVILAVIIGCYIWLGIKEPKVFSNIRDLTITMITVMFFIISTVLAVLFFYLSAKIEDARTAIDQAMTTADGKVEELGDKITEILKQILEPIYESQSAIAGVMNVLKILKSKGK